MNGKKYIFFDSPSMASIFYYSKEDNIHKPVHSTTHFINNYRQGEYKQYYYDGTLNIHCSYTKGDLDGVYKRYDENGYLWCKCYYTNGKINGIKYLYEDDKLIYLYEIDNPLSEFCNNMSSAEFEISLKDITTLINFKRHLRKRLKNKIIKQIDFLPKDIINIISKYKYI